MKQRIPVKFLAGLIVVSALLKTGWCSAATFTWNGSASADWFNASNWTPIGVPGSTDTIHVTNGTIILSNSVTINGVFSWSGGTLSGVPLTIGSQGAMVVAGNVLLENVLSNAGTVIMIGTANLSIFNNNANYAGGVYNLVGALWDIQTNANISCGYCNAEFFNNAGVFRKSLGSGTASVNLNFSNVGTVTNLAGTLSFNQGGLLTGNYNAAAGATINFASGNFTMGVPPTVTGLGICEFTGTTLTLAQSTAANLLLAGGNVVLGPNFQNGGAISNLTLNGSTLMGTNTVTGNIDWNSGTLGGPLTIASGGLMNVTGYITLENVLTNAGTVTMSGSANVSIYNNNANYVGGVYNLAGALWDIQTSANISCGYCNAEFFNNAGMFRRSSGSGTAVVNVNFSNGGTVTNLAGTLSFNQGGLLTGIYDAAAGTTINFASGNFTMGVPPVITGLGVCEFTGTTLTLAQSTAANLVLAGGNLVLAPGFQSGGAISNLTLNGSTLAGTNTVTGTLNWNSGTLGGPLTIASGGLMNVTGYITLENVLTNAGTVTMSGSANVSIYNNNANYVGGVYNLAGALWDIQTNANISCGYCNAEFFNNAGMFRRSSGSGSAVVNVNFSNGGTVTNLAGTLSFNQGGLLTGIYDAAAGATINFAAGNFTMGVPPVITGLGICEFTGTTLTLTKSTAANLLLVGGSVVLGPGFQNGGSISNLTLSGAALAGTNTVTGTLNWNSGTLGGPLTIASGGAMFVTGYITLENVLTNAGTVTMSGTANVSIYNNNANYLGGIYNLSGALWDIQTNANISCGYCNAEFFNNAGMFRKSLGSGTAVISVNFSNSGTVTNLAGTLSFNQGGLLAGSYNTAGGTMINFASGNFTMDVPPVITGLGVCEFTGTTLTLAQNVAANLLLAGGSVVLGPRFQNGGAISNLTLSGAALVGTNSVTGSIDWNSGTLIGPLTIASGGVMSITGYITLENVLSNAGTVTMNGTANVSIYNNNANYVGGVYNLGGALWDIQTNANITCGYCTAEFFNNAGEFRKSLSSGSSAVTVNFTNSGTVNALVGTLGFNGNFNTAGGTLAFGVSGLSSFGQIHLLGNVALNGTVSLAWLGGFTPAISNSFAVLNYGSESGAFSTLSLPSGSVGQGIYGATVFSVLITDVTMQSSRPVLTIEPINPYSVAVSWPTSSGNFILQTNTDLSSQSWSNVTSGISTVGTNYVLTTTPNGAAVFFRLRSP